MAKQKDEKSVVWIVLGILGLFFLFKTGFFGSLVTTCTNTEPNNIDTLKQDMLYINGTFDETADYFTFNNTQHTKYISTSSLGTYSAVRLVNLSCQTILADIYGHDNTTYYVKINQKDVLYSTTVYHWCNGANNVYMKGDLETLTGYQDYYIKCVTVDVPDQNTTNTTDNETATEDDETADENSVNSDVQVCTQEAKQCPDGSYVSRNPANNCEFDACPTTNAVQQTKSSLFVTAVLGIALLFSLYWMFEKGPNKGFFRSKKWR